MLDLMFLRALFILAIWTLAELINLSLFSLPIEMMICFCEELLVVILTWDLVLPELSMIF